MLLRYFRFSVSAVTFRLGLLLALGFLVTAVRGADPKEERFSATLSATQRAETGLAQLTENNIAIIDALVRQDEAMLKRRGSLGSFGRFSQRRSEHEIEIAGLNQLTPAQLARLDGLTAMRISPPPPMFNVEAMPRSPAPGISPQPIPKPYALEVHGSTTLAYGWSKAGTVRGGEMLLNLQDPSHHFSLTIGYSEYRGKGFIPTCDLTGAPNRHRSADLSPLDR